MSRRQLFPLSAVLLIVWLLSGCGTLFPTPTPTSTPTRTPTHTPTATFTPTNTPTATLPPSPKAGQWVGEPFASFSVTADGKVRDFTFVVQLNQGSCTISVDEITVETDGTFVIAEIVDLSSVSNFLALADALGIPTPAATQTSSGKVIDGHRISGKFDSPTTLTGAFLFQTCEGQIDLPATTGTWDADWKGQ